MKRILVWTLMILLTSSSLPVNAEDEFVLRNGIRFGDTVQQVRKKETAGFNKAKCSATQLETNSTTAAGFSNVSIKYSFTSEGFLKSVLWVLPAYVGQDTASLKKKGDAQYIKLKNALISKYGSPLGYSDGVFHVITGEAIDLILNMVQTSDDAIISVFKEYDEWDVLFGISEHVKIDITQWYVCQHDLAVYVTSLSYTYFSDDDLNQAIDKKNLQNHRTNLQNQSIENDL